MTTTTEALARAWADLPAQLQAHPGIKALHRAAIAAIDAAPSVEPVAPASPHIRAMAQAVIRQLSEQFPREEIDLDAVGLLCRVLVGGHVEDATPQAQPAASVEPTPCPTCDGDGRVPSKMVCTRCGIAGCWTDECADCGGTGITPQEGANG